MTARSRLAQILVALLLAGGATFVVTNSLSTPASAETAAHSTSA